MFNKNKLLFLQFESTKTFVARSRYNETHDPYNNKVKWFENCFTPTTRLKCLVLIPKCFGKC